MAPASPRPSPWASAPRSRSRPLRCCRSAPGAWPSVWSPTARAPAGAGYAVAVVARSRDELAETVGEVEAGGGQARAFVADVTDATAVDKVIGEVEQALGPIDVLVNNAGVLGPLGPLLTSTVG